MMTEKGTSVGDISTDNDRLITGDVTACLCLCFAFSYTCW